MTLTDDELSDPTAELTGGDDAHRRPISDVNAWLDGLDCGVRPALRALGELLVRVAERESAESQINSPPAAWACRTPDTCSTRNVN